MTRTEELMEMTGEVVQGTEVFADFEQRCQKVLEQANALIQSAPDWVTFYQEVLGVKGVVRRSFPSKEQLAAFKKTEAYDKIQWMLCQLRIRSNYAHLRKESTKVITVRLPKTLHAALLTEAREKATSVNKLCISKLLQFIDEDLVPPSHPEEEEYEKTDHEAGL